MQKTYLAALQNQSYLPLQKLNAHRRRRNNIMAAVDTLRSPAASNGVFGGFISTLMGAFVSWNDSRVTRNALAKLTDRELADIGLARGDIEDVARGIHY